MAIIYSDDFTGSPDGTLLTVHNPAWIEAYSSGGHAVIHSGVCYDAGTNFTRNVLTGVVPPSNDYAVEAVLARKTATTRNIYLCVRCSADSGTYYSFHHQRSGSAILRKTINGSSTTMDASTRSLPENGSETWRLEVEGEAIRCYIDGSLLFSATDNAITSGFAGLHFYTDPYDSSLDGPVVESYKVETFGGPVGPDVKTYAYAGGELIPVTVKLWQSDGVNWTQRNAKLWTSDGTAWADKGTI